MAGMDAARAENVTARTWAGFAAMGFAMFMAVLDIQIVATSLPEIQAGLGIRPEAMSWIQTSYLIAEVVAIPLSGWLHRRFGMRRLFAAVVLGFTLASIACAASQGFATLIVARVAQGFAAGAIIPTVFSAVFLLFPFRLQGLATTVAGVLAVLAPTLGPLIGGWITETHGWHWLFLVNVVPGFVIVAMVTRLLPAETDARGETGPFDWPTLVLMAASLASLEIALKEAPKQGWLSPLVLGLGAVCVVAGFAFVRRALNQARPVVDVGAFADRDFTIGCWLSFATGVGLYGSVYLMPVFLAFVRDHTAFETGRIMVVMGLAQLVAAPVAVALERRMPALAMTALGLVVFGAGLGMSYWQTPASDYDALLWPQIVRGVGVMFCLLPVTRVALGHLPEARVPDASGLFNLMRNLGGAIGIAAIDTVLYGRAAGHGEAIVARLQAGDPVTAAFVGLQTDRFVGKPLGPIDDATKEMVRPLVERAALVMSINEAWALMAVVTLLALAALPFASWRGRPAAMPAPLPPPPRGDGREAR
jgi:DHA2 family multidrug resistance protein